MEMLINEVCPCVDMYMPIYAINLPKRKDRREHIVSEFNKRSEFELHLSMQVAIVIADWDYGKVL